MEAGAWMGPLEEELEVELPLEEEEEDEENLFISKVWKNTKAGVTFKKCRS